MKPTQPSTDHQEPSFRGGNTNLAATIVIYISTVRTVQYLIIYGVSIHLQYRTVPVCPSALTQTQPGIRRTTSSLPHAQYLRIFSLSLVSPLWSIVSEKWLLSATHPSPTHQPKRALHCSCSCICTSTVLYSPPYKIQAASLGWEVR